MKSSPHQVGTLGPKGSGAEPGRRVRVTSISVSSRRSLGSVAEVVDREGTRGADLIVLPEAWAVETRDNPEPIDGPVISTMSMLARTHRVNIVCPLDRQSDTRRLNSAVLIDRGGLVAGVYDKLYPYWNEFDLRPPVEAGDEVEIFEADFGRVGIQICFDVNFPGAWKTLADRGAELVVWPSAYSAGIALQAHAVMNHYYVVSSTCTADCAVYDITGRELLYEKSNDINISRASLDLDRGIYHENFNLDRLDRLLTERGADVEMETHLLREQWFVLRARRAGVSARQLAREYGFEELHDYISRSRAEIDEIREARRAE